MLKKLWLIVSFTIFAWCLDGKEGMWLPLLLDGYTIEDMQANGLKLSAEDIYSINHSSLKDAVVIFGGGCTGEMISGQGLLLTNHHCGQSVVQAHSTVENNYLEKGFWAESLEKEIPHEGLTATFLVRVEDVTDSVLAGVEDDFTEAEREALVSGNIKKIIDQATSDNHFDATVKPFYHGNKYYLFVHEEFKDVRLVGAPPESIGNFGGDTDNWMWPRHGGDFMLFRVYADSANKPAPYSEKNVPYKPKKFLPISLAGVKENDFTMVMGFPGWTYEYMSADAVEYIVEKNLPNKIMLRDKRVAIMQKYMREDEEVKLKYSSKFNRLTNSWKKWKGIMYGMYKKDGLELKEAKQAYLNQLANRGAAPRDLEQVSLELEKVISEWKNIDLAYDYLVEALLGIELMGYTGEFISFANNADNYRDDLSGLVDDLEGLQRVTTSFFKNYHLPIDKEICVEMISAFIDSVDARYYSNEIRELINKHDGNVKEYVDWLFKKSMFVDQKKMEKTLHDFSYRKYKKITKDPAFLFYNSFANVYRDQIRNQKNDLESKMDSLYRQYLYSLLEIDNPGLFYPDANFTMRVTYGKVEGYTPADAIKLDYISTLEGVMEKEDPESPEFIVPARLKQLYKDKDFGSYAMNDTLMPVCFIASNHTSGGNSGSPVLNGRGELIGINFDRNWEGTMSDYYYNPNICRNISVDIRYVLFIIDKFAGAGHLIDEMKIVRD